MRIRPLLSILVACGAACGCATPQDEPSAAQSTSPPAVRTGSRLPGDAGASGHIGGSDWRDQKSRESGSFGRVQ